MGTQTANGHLHVYTGDGKGKTTSSVGMVIRALGAGQRVAFLQFDKGFDGDNEHYSERAVLRTLPNLDMWFFGAERMVPGKKFRFKNESVDFEQAAAGLAKAKQLVSEANHFLIVCDEAITCTMTGLYEREQLMNLVRLFKEKPHCNLVLTGRGGFKELFEQADLVSEICMRKHYFYSGTAASKGIDY